MNTSISQVASAANDDVIMTDAPSDPEPQQTLEEQSTQALAAIADELRALMGSVSDEVRPEWGHPDRVKRWHRLVDHATTPQVVAQSLICLLGCHLLLLACSAVHLPGA